MNAIPTISVIMPCHNARETITESIESVLGQTYHALELIVVDDGSTDSSSQVLRALQAEDDRLKVILQDNRGPGAARNAGLREARGDLIAFLDADDTWSPDCLMSLLAGLEAAPDAVLAYCGWQNSGLAPQYCKPYIPPDYERGGKLEFFIQHCPWPIHAALVRRHALTAVGGFDEQWTSSMDFDLWLRIGARQKIIRVPKVMAFYRHDSSRPQITGNKSRVAMNHWEVQQKYLKENPEVFMELGRETIRKLTDGELMHRGFDAYWRRDLKTARTIFRKVMGRGYGGLRDWRYMLPSLLPEKCHKTVIDWMDK